MSAEGIQGILEDELGGERVLCTVLRTPMPVLEIEGESFVMLTPKMAGIPKSEFGTPVARVEQHRFEIISAVYFLLTGI